MHSIKDAKQKEALDAAREHPRPLVVLATGVGKSKVAIDRAKEVVAINPDARIILSVPTQKLRDENWHEEFIKWGAGEIWDKNLVTRACYVSMNKLKGEHFDLQIGDEIHNITEANSEFYENNTVDQVIGLTATLPEDKDKKKILKELGFEVVYRITLDEAVDLGLVSPYEIVVIEVEPDNTDKYIKAGSKDKPFCQTEKKYYDYLSSQIRRLMFSNRPQDKKILQFKILDRMRFIYNMKAKTSAAQWLLKNIIPKDERTLIFSGGIDQAELLAKHTFHSKSPDDSGLEKFKKRKINQLACVMALNEGANIEEVHNALVVQVNSKELSLVQRIGRIIRFRDGHLGKVYIIGALGTKDMDWIKNALEGFDKSRIQYVRFENVVNGNTRI